MESEDAGWRAEERERTPCAFICTSQQLAKPVKLTLLCHLDLHMGFLLLHSLLFLGVRKSPEVGPVKCDNSSLVTFGYFWDKPWFSSLNCTLHTFALALVSVDENVADAKEIPVKQMPLTTLNLNFNCSTVCLSRSPVKCSTINFLFLGGSFLSLFLSFSGPQVSSFEKADLEKKWEEEKEIRDTNDPRQKELSIIESALTSPLPLISLFLPLILLSLSLSHSLVALFLATTKDGPQFKWLAQW